MQDNNQNKPQMPRKRKPDIVFGLIVILLIVGVIIFIQQLTQPKAIELTYKELEVALVDEINPVNSETLKAQPVGGQNYDMFTLTGELVDGTEFTAIITVAQFNEISSTHSIKLYELEESWFLSFLINIIPYIIMIGFFIFIFRSQGNGKAFDFGKSTARLSRGKSVTFADVAGCDEEKEELVEIIDFLKNPRKYAEIGARIPKGVLLFGNPGTGKTLLAKAVAGEANVPFFSISGSDFVEMFVGVGASRVRDMFKTAKENAPCIIFIDEIDAVGRQRGAGMPRKFVLLRPFA